MYGLSAHCALKPNLRCGSIPSLRVSRTNFSARNMTDGVSRHPVLADIVGGVDSIAIYTQYTIQNEPILKATGVLVIVVNGQVDSVDCELSLPAACTRPRCLLAIVRWDKTCSSVHTTYWPE